MTSYQNRGKSSHKGIALFAGHHLDSVSFMGMGEPLANPYLSETLSVLSNPALFGLSQRKITISTIGIIPGIRMLTKDFPQINLAFSLHSPFESQRCDLMPISKKYPLDDVMQVLDEHVRQIGRRLFIAYIMLEGINTSPDHAKALAGLLKARGLRAHLYHVDLIPYNQTDKTQQAYRAANHSSLQKFKDILVSRGVNVTVRSQFGSRIGAACGQLCVNKRCLQKVHGRKAKIIYLE